MTISRTFKSPTSPANEPPPQPQQTNPRYNPHARLVGGGDHLALAAMSHELCRGRNGNRQHDDARTPSGDVVPPALLPATVPALRLVAFRQAAARITIERHHATIQRRQNTEAYHASRETRTAARV